MRVAVLVSYIAFVLVGVSAGIGGVLLLAQMADYGVDRATIGITFFTVSAGFFAAGLSTGALIHRFGVGLTPASGAAAFVLTRRSAGQAPWERGPRPAGRGTSTASSSR